jgi:hypothetical protein
MLVDNSELEFLGILPTNWMTEHYLSARRGELLHPHYVISCQSALGVGYVWCLAGDENQKGQGEPWPFLRRSAHRDYLIRSQRAARIIHAGRLMTMLMVNIVFSALSRKTTADWLFYPTVAKLKSVALWSS